MVLLTLEQNYSQFMLNNYDIEIGQWILIHFTIFIRNVLCSALINEKRNEKNIDMKK